VLGRAAGHDGYARLRSKLKPNDFAGHKQMVAGLVVVSRMQVRVIFRATANFDADRVAPGSCRPDGDSGSYGTERGLTCQGHIGRYQGYWIEGGYWRWPRMIF